jgi:hypothetical protein
MQTAAVKPTLCIGVSMHTHTSCSFCSLSDYVHLLQTQVQFCQVSRTVYLHYTAHYYNAFFLSFRSILTAPESDYC